MANRVDVEEAIDGALLSGAGDAMVLVSGVYENDAGQLFVVMDGSFTSGDLRRIAQTLDDHETPAPADSMAVRFMAWVRRWGVE